jgi:sugar lactone lactonase YvrE
MLRKQLSPKTVGLATLAILATIQLVYWRLLVYVPAGPPGGMPKGGGGPIPGPPMVLGREDVEVDTLAGEAPGYRDGPGWYAQFAGPNALAIRADGNLFVADSRNHRIRLVSPVGQVTTVAGSGAPSGQGGRADGPPAAAQFRFPSGVASSADGTIYVADTGNHRICRLRDGLVSTLAGGTEGRADGQGSAARFRFPAALALDAAGALWVADLGNRAARRVDAAGGVTTPAAMPPVIAEALGDVAAPRSGRMIQASPDGKGLPTATQFAVGRRSAEAFLPRDPAAQPAEGGQAVGPLRLFADADNSVLLAQRDPAPPLLVAGRRIKGIVANGTEDGPGHRAAFAVPCAVALAADGTCFVADYEGNRIRKVRLPRWLLAGRQPPTSRRSILRQRGDRQRGDQRPRWNSPRPGGGAFPGFGEP